jgi:hypothetical protein
MKPLNGNLPSFALTHRLTDHPFVMDHHFTWTIAFYVDHCLTFMDDRVSLFMNHRVSRFDEAKTHGAH